MDRPHYSVATAALAEVVAAPHVVREFRWVCLQPPPCHRTWAWELTFHPSSQQWFTSLLYLSGLVPIGIEVEKLSSKPISKAFYSHLS